MHPSTNGSQPTSTHTETFSAEEAKTQDQQPLLPDPPPQGDFVGAPPKRPRGFAAMDPRLVSEIASKGGKAAHARGTAHEFTSVEAREAGRKGGHASQAKRRGTPERS